MMRLLRAQHDDAVDLEEDLARLAAAVRADLHRQLLDLLKDPRRRASLVERVLTDVEHALMQQLRDELVSQLTDNVLSRGTPASPETVDDTSTEPVRPSS